MTHSISGPQGSIRLPRCRVVGKYHCWENGDVISPRGLVHKAASYASACEWAEKADARCRRNRANYKKKKLKAAKRT